MKLFSQITEPMKLLTAADPEIAGEIGPRLAQTGTDPQAPVVTIMVEDVIIGLSHRRSLGQTIADGYISMITTGVDQSRIEHYSRIVRREAVENTTYAEILADSLVPVLTWGNDSLVDDFLHAAALLKRKWLYALSGEPLKVVSRIIGPENTSAGQAWVKFLYDVFSHDLTYNQFRRFSGVFPKAVCAWPAAKRSWRINQLRRVVRKDFNLACAFTDALNRELSLLSEEGLKDFTSQGLARYEQNETRGLKFLGLATRTAVDTCHRLRTTGVLSLNRRQLASYLQARCGRPIPVRPISTMSGILKTLINDDTLVCFDGRNLFLVDEINRYANHQENDFLYKALAWIEAGLFEFNTFDFDLEQVTCASLPTDILNNIGDDGGSDLNRFYRAFPDPRQARDLFTVFEYGRVRTLLEKTYPGGVRRYFPPIREEMERLLQSGGAPGLISVLFAGIVLRVDMSLWLSGHDQIMSVENILKIFNSCTAGAREAEASARGVLRVLTDPGSDVFMIDHFYTPLRTPFGLGVRPELFYAAFAGYEEQAEALKRKIFRITGESVHKSVIRRRLMEEGGMLSTDHLYEMIHDARRKSGCHDDEIGKSVPLVDIDIDDLCDDRGVRTASRDDFNGKTFRYHEWDHFIGDYLADHVLVRERESVPGDTDFYPAVLSRYSGLIKKIRYAFEMLKPEAISILRKWREGDDFDYRQLLEYAVDKKSGRTPSERIYIKRLKQERDMAVLLLLDFSRSTSNKVAGSETTMVLDVEKEALVLFCEALNVTGDMFAIAGFSGTGRLGVDYFPVKSFNEPITADVEQRIGMISPQRNTRMGAAIRHATAVFGGMTARTKLLIIISDGFPNDIDYKREYAMADTRRALLEARTRGIIAHSITINITGDTRLDNLYGRVRHSVISDVRELPDRLIRIYGRLTG